MGLFSYNCKECGHPLLCPQATSKGINEWMSRAVILTNRDELFVGEYDGYGRAGGVEELDYHACLHEACWEKAGKPRFAHYGSPSSGAADQGWFFNDGDHDLIDPCITEGREELLRAGVEARTKLRYDQKARDLREMVAGYGRTDERKPWERRFSLMNRHKDGEKLPGQWYVSDRLHLLGDEERYVSGTEAEVWAGLEIRFNTYLETDEAKALLARALETRDESRRAYFEHVKAKGRYTIGYCPSRHPDLPMKEGRYGARPAHVTKFYVQDAMTLKDVVVFDYTGAGDDEIARSNQAATETARLNAAWAAEGYPWDFDAMGDE